VRLVVDVSAAAADDRDSPGGFPANSGTEDLQISSTAARAAVLYVADTSGLQAVDGRCRRHAGHHVTGQRTQAKDGKYREADKMAELGRAVAGQR